MSEGQEGAVRGEAVPCSYDFSQSAHRSVARFVQYVNPQPGQVTLRSPAFLSGFSRSGRSSGGRSAYGSATQLHGFGNLPVSSFMFMRPQLSRGIWGRGTIPDRRDNRIDATFGFKWSVPCTKEWNTFCARRAQVGQGITFITSVVMPLNNGGLRTGIIWSLGVQYKF